MVQCLRVESFQMQGLTESEINQQMNLAYIPLYYGMLVDKKSYQQLTEENPELAKYNYALLNTFFITSYKSPNKRSVQSWEVSSITFIWQ